MKSKEDIKQYIRDILEAEREENWYRESKRRNRINDFRWGLGFDLGAEVKVIKAGDYYETYGIIVDKSQGEIKVRHRGRTQFFYPWDLIIA